MTQNKIYVSGKITGDDNWKEKFQKAENALRKMGFTVLSPRMIDATLSYEDYMTIDFAMISVCDSIYMLDDWEQSPGAKRELEYARAINKVVIQQALTYE